MTRGVRHRSGAAAGRDPLTLRAGRWSARHPWLAIAAWVAFVATALVAGGLAGTVRSTAQDGLRGELALADRIERAGAFPQPPATENVLVTAPEGSLDLARARAAAAEVSTRLRALGQVAGVADPVVSPDRRALLVEVSLTGPAEDADTRVAPLLGVTADVARRYPDLRLEQVGSASLARALTETLAADFRKAELVSVPVALVILLFSFGALIAAGVPVVLALSSVAGALGLSQLASHLFPAGELVDSVILLIGMAVGVDYSLFYLRREREERARGRDHRDAVEVAAATSGHAVLVSGLAVVVAMASLFLVRDTTFDSLATGSVLVVTVAVVGSLTVLPAILALLGRWVDRPRVPVLGRRIERAGRSRLWAAVLRPALRRPLATLLLSLVALGALALPALQLTLKRPTSTDLPRSIPQLRTYDRVAAAFPGNDLGASHRIAIRADAAAGAGVDRQLAALGTVIAQDHRFAQDRAPRVRRSADGTVRLVTVHVTGASDGPAATGTLQRLREELLPRTVGTVPGARWAVAGRTATDTQLRARLSAALPKVITCVLVTTFVVMLVSFRSVALAVTSVLLNVLSVAAAYGVLVLVFQHAWAEDLLGFTSNGAVVIWLPLMLFVILFGLSMDYHVFVVSRIREAVARGVPTRAAIEEGIVSSASTVSSAAAIMVAVFGIFATLSVVEFKQLGVGLAAAILIDATLVRAVVLPSVMRLLGEANWWAPRWMGAGRGRAG